MPLYDFECLTCGHIFEQERKMSDALPPCASCGSMEIETLLSPPAIIFKGKGFYKTDSTSPARKSLPKKEVGESEKSGEASPEITSKKEESSSKDVIKKSPEPSAQGKANESAKTGVNGEKKTGE